MSGTNTALWPRTLFTIAKNKKVPNSDTAHAAPTRNIGLAPGRQTTAITTPNLHHCIVPAVVGDTNLFCIILCIISPATARLEPATSMLQRRGSLPTKKIPLCSPLKLNKSSGDMSATPTKSEQNEHAASIKICKNGASIANT